ncbi:alpha/beta hydrolase family protein [Amycolatopsis sacchari]|uniref:alpha/beta hydrolase family protein n=1 Tax=Amycolatopsis sacchari TaxID=115433 RepID=UPI001FE25EFC|nr:alpha/beta hydrolase [Amycolatopsis sacchari]
MTPIALRLPEPTGPHPVGARALHLVDHARSDPWLPVEQPRELMLTLWFPAAAPGTRRNGYLTPLESELVLRAGHVVGLPPDVLSTTRTHAYDDVPVADRTGPLVLLSPGFGKPRAILSGLAEELASHGYLVAGIDHTHESAATTFPDGRLATCLAGNSRRNGAFWEKLVAGRAADASFVLDELTRDLEPSGIAMAGHSVGGASALTAVSADPRIQAGVNIDGTVYPALLEPGLATPFLFMGRAAQYTRGSGPAADTWETAWALLTGWKRWYTVRGALHGSFTDIGLLGEQAGLDAGAALPADRVSRLTRDHVRAFLDLHLLGKPAPLLESEELVHAGA